MHVMEESVRGMHRTCSSPNLDISVDENKLTPRGFGLDDEPPRDVARPSWPRASANLADAWRGLQGGWVGEEAERIVRRASTPTHEEQATFGYMAPASPSPERSGDITLQDAFNSINCSPGNVDKMRRHSHIGKLKRRIQDDRSGCDLSPARSSGACSSPARASARAPVGTPLSEDPTVVGSLRESMVLGTFASDLEKLMDSMQNRIVEHVDRRLESYCQPDELAKQLVALLPDAFSGNTQRQDSNPSVVFAHEKVPRMTRDVSVGSLLAAPVADQSGDGRARTSPTTPSVRLLLEVVPPKGTVRSPPHDCRAVQDVDATNADVSGAKDNACSLCGVIAERFDVLNVTMAQTSKRLNHLESLLGALLCHRGTPSDSATIDEAMLCARLRALRASEVTPIRSEMEQFCGQLEASLPLLQAARCRGNGENGNFSCGADNAPAFGGRTRILSPRASSAYGAFAETVDGRSDAGKSPAGSVILRRAEPRMSPRTSPRELALPEVTPRVLGAVASANSIQTIPSPPRQKLASPRPISASIGSDNGRATPVQRSVLASDSAQWALPGHEGLRAVALMGRTTGPLPVATSARCSPSPSPPRALAVDMVPGSHGQLQHGNLLAFSHANLAPARAVTPVRSQASPQHSPCLRPATSHGELASVARQTSHQYARSNSPTVRSGPLPLATAGCISQLQVAPLGKSLLGRIGGC